MGLLPESYEVIDTGIKRNMSDLLNESSHVTTTLNAAASVVYNTPRAVPVDQMRPIIESGLYDIVKELIKHCSVTRNYYSSARFRLAACATILGGGDKQYVLQQYAALCRLNFKLMSNQSMTLVKQVTDRKINARDNKMETLARGLRVFDTEQRESDRSDIKPEDLQQAKEFVLNALKITVAEPLQPEKPEELLNTATPDPKSYIHRCGHSRKHTEQPSTKKYPNN